MRVKLHTSDYIYVYLTILSAFKLHTFWKYIRAGLYDAADLPKDLATLKSLQLQTVSNIVLIEDAINISLAHDISAYDASYVAFSQQVGATLLTLEKTGESIISDFIQPSRFQIIRDTTFRLNLNNIF